MISESDKRILRDAAKRLAEIAALPIQAERRALWKKHNDLGQVRPLIYISPEGAWRELLPPQALLCTAKDARGMEGELRRRIYVHEHFQSDNVAEPEWVVEKAVRNSGWGLEPERIPSSMPTGAWAFKPVLRERADLKKLKLPVLRHDERATQARLAQARELFGDILDVKLKGVWRVHFNLMALYTKLRGLEEMMVEMAEEPERLHEAMAFLEEGYRGVVRQYVEQNLLSLNNDNSYHASGGNGYTDQLPAPGFDPARVRPSDMWASAEAQELAQVSPAMHAEFCLAYEKRLLEPFGLNGYGCCEDLTRKLDDVFTIKNIRRISISPFADVDRCAEKLGARAIFSWKPHPSHLVGAFSPDLIRRYIQHTVDVAAKNGCVLEIVLKDTHTCEERPERFDEWSRIARRIVEAV